MSQPWRDDADDPSPGRDTFILVPADSGRSGRIRSDVNSRCRTVFGPVNYRSARLHYYISHQWWDGFKMDVCNSRKVGGEIKECAGGSIVTCVVGGLNHNASPLTGFQDRILISYIFVV